MNKNGAIGSPCLRPLDGLNYLDGLSLTKTKIEEDYVRVKQRLSSRGEG